MNNTEMFMCCLDALYHDGCYSIYYSIDTNDFYKAIGIHSKYTSFVSKDDVKKHARLWILQNVEIK